MANVWLVVPAGRLACLLILAGATAVGGWLVWPWGSPGGTEPAPEPGPRTVLAGRVIAVDPGHGGFDPGVEHAASQLVEKEITLDVSLRLAAHLERLGARVVLTRDRDMALGEGAREDLDARLAIAREAGAELLVSIHVNSFPDPIYFGAQTFYDPAADEGRRLAELLQEELVRMDPENFRLARPFDLYLLQRADLPAAVVELGFMTNERDRLLLAGAEGRERLAVVLTVGLARYLAGHQPGPNPS